MSSHAGFSIEASNTFSPQLSVQGVVSTIQLRDTVAQTRGARPYLRHFFNESVAAEIGYLNLTTMQGLAILSGFDMDVKYFLQPGTRTTRRADRISIESNPFYAFYMGAGYRNRLVTVIDNVVPVSGFGLNFGSIWSPFSSNLFTGSSSLFLSGEIAYESLTSGTEDTFKVTSILLGTGLFL
jgi:hypothetical protein